MTQAIEETLAQTHSEQYIQGIEIGEVEARIFGCKVLHQETLPLEIEDEAVSDVELQIGLGVYRNIYYLVAAANYWAGELTLSELMAIEAGAKAGYRYCITARGEK